MGRFRLLEDEYGRVPWIRVLHGLLGRLNQKRGGRFHHRLLGRVVERRRTIVAGCVTDETNRQNKIAKGGSQENKIK